jgi:hypothetical protein
MRGRDEYRVKFDGYVDIFIKRSAKSNQATMVQRGCPNVARLDSALVIPTALLLSDKSWFCYTNVDHAL